EVKLRSRSGPTPALRRSPARESAPLTCSDGTADYLSVIHLTAVHDAGEAGSGPGPADMVSPTGFLPDRAVAPILHLSTTAHIVLVSSFVAMANRPLEVSSA